jgi:hypothetical protein
MQPRSLSEGKFLAVRCGKIMSLLRNGVIQKLEINVSNSRFAFADSAVSKRENETVLPIFEKTRF